MSDVTGAENNKAGWETVPVSGGLFKRYFQARVTVYYASGISDTGWLTWLETPWIEITKDTNERLLIPMMAIRLIKVLETPPQNNDAETLLRAAEPHER